MKTVLIILLFGLGFNLNASFRLININKEITNSSFCAEVVFTGYDSLKVPYYSSKFQRVIIDSITGEEIADTNYTDSTFMMTGISFLPYLKKGAKIQKANCIERYSLIRYHERPKILPKRIPSHGFWPKLNDTCLVILNASGFVSTFALKVDSDYIFWDPYYNINWISIFVFDHPFLKYPKEPLMKVGSFAADKAKDEGVKDFSYFHCKVKVKDFWSKYATKYG